MDVGPGRQWGPGAMGVGGRMQGQVRQQRSGVMGVDGEPCDQTRGSVPAARAWGQELHSQSQEPESEPAAMCPELWLSPRASTCQGWGSAPRASSCQSSGRHSRQGLGSQYLGPVAVAASPELGVGSQGLELEPAATQTGVGARHQESAPRARSALLEPGADIH